jgi:hypothetical protein
VQDVQPDRAPLELTHLTLPASVTEPISAPDSTVLVGPDSFI